MNRKRIERLYSGRKACPCGANAGARAEKPLRGVLPTPSRPKARTPEHGLFVTDSLAHGRRWRSLAIVDDRSRETVAIEAAFPLTGERITRVLERLAQTRGLPNLITVDNGPEFAGKVLDMPGPANTR